MQHLRNKNTDIVFQYSNFQVCPKHFVFVFSGFIFYSFWLRVRDDDEIHSHLHCSEVCVVAEITSLENLLLWRNNNSDDAALLIFQNRLFLIKFDYATHKRFSGREQLIMGIGHREPHREVDGNEFTNKRSELRNMNCAFFPLVSRREQESKTIAMVQMKRCPWFFVGSKLTEWHFEYTESIYANAFDPLDRPKMCINELCIYA